MEIVYQCLHSQVVGSRANDFERMRMNMTVYVEDIVFIVLELSGGGREEGREGKLVTCTLCVSTC